MEIQEILSELGYQITNHGHYLSAPALYRNGDNLTSLTIYPDKNLVIDWVTGDRFNIEGLIKITLRLTDKIQVQEWLKNKNIVINAENPEPQLNVPQIFPEQIIQELIPDHSYWIKRGISEEVMKEFCGGISNYSRLKNRYVFPVRNQNNQLVGLVGRTLIDSSIKWKILGEKRAFHYIETNREYINRTKEVILVESIGDGLSLTMAGIRNWWCLFGVSLSNELLTTLIGSDLKKVIISVNNDGGAGNEAARKISSRLLKFFDKRQVEVKLPHLKDLNEQLQVYGGSSIKRMYS